MAIDRAEVQAQSEHAQNGQTHDENPKIAPDGNDNQIKDPEDWVTGDEPMTGAQASYLKTLCEQTQRPDLFELEITKSEASKRIDVLRESRQGYN